MSHKSLFSRRSSTPNVTTAKSPSSDVSPTSRAARRASDYFSSRRVPSSQSSSKVALKTPQPAENLGVVSPPLEASATESPSGSSEAEETENSRRASDATSGEQADTASRKSSVTSVSFRPPRNPSLPQGLPKQTDRHRLRAASPDYVKFRRHVGFDNLPVGEATKNNTSSFTLNVRHQGYHAKRRSRTFMVGVDEHAYSDYALEWLLDHLVDDGDEVVCVRVVETPIKSNDRAYKEEAQRLLQSIQEKNTKNHAICIILEYSVGKLHATFQRLIQIYQPSMLIVGTRGRSLGGIQGLVNTRNSFSKYCLQYSPVPVVVVRPDEKRKKKKDKRAQDPSRNTYIAMLARNHGRHEADSENSSLYELEDRISPDEEAHRVATALGLPAAFDPTIKPFHATVHQPPRASVSGDLNEYTSAEAPDGRQGGVTSPPPLVAASNDSDEEESDDDGGEFEVVSGDQLLQQSSLQKERLHAMEMGEAAALLKSGAKVGLDEEDEDEDEEGEGENGKA